MRRPRYGTSSVSWPRASGIAKHAACCSDSPGTAPGGVQALTPAGLRVTAFESDARERKRLEELRRKERRQHEATGDDRGL